MDVIQAPFNHAAPPVAGNPARRVTSVRYMAVHRIRIVGDPVLHKHTRPVTAFDDELRALVQDLFDTLTAANGVGLAANQIGVDQRVFVFDCPDEDGERHCGVVVNPKLSTSGAPETMPDPDDDFEGCLSVPGKMFPTGRASWARVEGFDTEGQPVTVEGTGFFARCLQHETDHLDGLLYLNRLIGRHAREAKRMLKREGWGVPDLWWMPGEVPDPFGH